MNQPELIHHPQDLRPGDMFLGPIGGLTGLAVGAGQFLLGEAFRSGTLSVRHAGILTRAYVPALHHADGQMGRREQPPMLAQAMPGGSEIVPVELDKHWTEECAWVRLPEDYPGQAEDAAAVARLMVHTGVGYSFLSYPALAAYKAGIRNERIRNWINRRQEPIQVDLPSGMGIPAGETPGSWKGPRLPVEAICSVFNDQAWSLVGKDLVDGTHPQAVTPGLLASTLNELPGTVWCRPSGKLSVSARSWRIT